MYRVICRLRCAMRILWTFFGGAAVELTRDDLARIEGALATVQVQGDRYPASHQTLVNR